MWCTYLIITVAVLGYHVQAAALIENNRIPNSDLERLAKRSGKMFQKCPTDQNAVDTFQVCRSTIIPTITKMVGKNTRECREHIPDIIECLSEFAEKLEPCLEPEQHFLKPFVLHYHQESLDYLCEHQNVIFGEPAASNTTQCFSLMEGPRKNMLLVCSANSKVMRPDTLFNVMSKSEVCQDVINLRSCYGRMLDKHCPNAPEYKEILMGMMQAGLEQCSEE